MLIISLFNISIFPEVGLTKPIIALAIVVFPDPDSPTIACVVPDLIKILISSTALT